MSAGLAYDELDDSTNLYFTQNFFVSIIRIAFHCWELRTGKLVHSTWAYTGKVFIKLQDNSDKKETKYLSQLINKFPNHTFNFND